ncbi:MAG: hypothetical protein KBG30_12855 [Bacteroidales bacterium]|nr:hypothetical protein [Bacteroidales bacterium]
MEEILYIYKTFSVNGLFVVIYTLFVDKVSKKTFYSGIGLLKEFRHTKILRSDRVIVSNNFIEKSDVNFMPKKMSKQIGKIDNTFYSIKKIKSTKYKYKTEWGDIEAIYEMKLFTKPPAKYVDIKEEVIMIDCRKADFSKKELYTLFSITKTSPELATAIIKQKTDIDIFDY